MTGDFRGSNREALTSRYVSNWSQTPLQSHSVVHMNLPIRITLTGRAGLRFLSCVLHRQHLT